MMRLISMGHPATGHVRAAARPCLDVEYVCPGGLLLDRVSCYFVDEKQSHGG